MRAYHRLKAEEITEVAVRMGDIEGLTKVNVPPSQPSESVGPSVRTKNPVTRVDPDDPFDRPGEVAAMDDEDKRNEPESSQQEEKVFLTLTGGEKRVIPKKDLLLSPVVEKRDDKFISVGDMLVETYDIMDDRLIHKVYDKATFGRYFRQSLN